MAKKHVVYWDSDAFLALINGDKSAAEMHECKNVWSAAEKGLVHIVTSTLTTAEVIYRKGTAKLDPIHRPLVSNFFRQDFISQKPLTREIAELARDIVWDTSVKPKDAIHVATAAYYRIGELHTFDGGLCGLKSVSVNGYPVSLRQPIAPNQAEIHIEDPEKQ